MGARTGRCCVLSFFVLLAVRGASAEAERKLAPPAPIPEEREAAAELLARWLDTGDDRAAA